MEFLPVRRQKFDLCSDTVEQLPQNSRCRLGVMNLGIVHNEEIASLEHPDYNEPRE
jgi:hypothetical protein